MATVNSLRARPSAPAEAANDRDIPESRRRSRLRPALWVALALSVAVHTLWSLWPTRDVTVPSAPVLTATLKEMPPPPPAAAPEPPPKPAPQRPARAAPRTPTIAARAPSPVALPPAVDSPPSEAQGSAAAGAQDASADAGEGSAAAEAAPSSTAPPIALPPRVDLAYKVYLGKQGFMIGDATYRFEHDGDRYRIATVGQARGLAALIVHGTGIVESRGIITPAG
ncbi:MAG TPA: hypothetical protein VLU41_15190, partial [Ideonella sp.]|nr:hypothetical protein [Ideonella sp.]